MLFLSPRISRVNVLLSVNNLPRRPQLSVNGMVVLSPYTGQSGGQAVAYREETSPSTRITVCLTFFRSLDRDRDLLCLDLDLREADSRRPCRERCEPSLKSDSEDEVKSFRLLDRAPL